MTNKKVISDKNNKLSLYQDERAKDNFFLMFKNKDSISEIQIHEKQYPKLARLITSALKKGGIDATLTVTKKEK